MAGSPLLSQAPDVIHHVPHLGWTHARPAVQAFHSPWPTNAIANIHEDLAVGSAVLPLFIGQIGRAHFAVSHGGRDLADAVGFVAVAIRTKLVIELFSGGD